MDNLQLSDSWHYFNCLGPKKAGSNVNITRPNTKVKSLVLFGHKLDYASSLATDSKLLFRMAKQCLMLLDSGPGGNHQALGSSDGSSDADFYAILRGQLCDFLAYIQSFLVNISTDSDSYGWLLDSLVRPVSDDLFTFRLFVDRLGLIPSHTNLSFSIAGSQNESSYHKLHVYLDICCYHLNILLKLCQCQKEGGLFQDLQVPGCQDDSFNKFALLFIADLLTLAVARFEKSSRQDDLTEVSPFNCQCIREVWVMLITLLDNCHKKDKNNKSFWSLSNSLFDKVRAKSPVNQFLSSVIDSTDIIIPENIACTEPAIFKLWMLSHLAQLYHIENIAMQVNYFQLESVLKQYTTSESSITEANLRFIIPMITPLVFELWVPKSEAVMTLWEYYHRRLNSTFLLSGTASESNHCNIKSLAWIDSIKSLTDTHRPSVSNSDSWSLFLRLLGLYLRNSEPRHWHQIRGRIYSKLSPTKLQSLTDVGIYNVTSLFLTLCFAVNVKEVSVKFVDLLGLLDPQDVMRKTMLWKAHLAVLQLYTNEGFDLQTIAKALMTDVNNISSKDDSSSKHLMSVFIGEIPGLFQFSPDSIHSESVLIDVWVHQYSLKCTQSDADQLYCTLLSLVEKVTVACMEITTVHLTNMCEALWKHVLPSVVMLNTINHDVQAMLGYQLTTLALYNQVPSRSFTSIFFRFLNSQSLDVNIIQRYLFLLMSHEITMNTLVKMENYQGLLIRTWLRCVILSVDESSKNLSSLTRCISKLKDILELASHCGTQLDEQDLFGSFLQMITEYSGPLSGCISFYLSQVESCLTRTPLKSVQLATRIFTCAAKFILYAPQFAYNKTASSSKNLVLTSVMTHLLLPPALNNPNFKLNEPERAALHSTLHLFVRGLVALRPRTDQYINKCLKELVVQYLPRLVPRSTVGSTLDSFVAPGMTHPLLVVFDDLQTDTVAETERLVLEILSSNFIACKGKTPHAHAVLALRFLQDVLRKGNSSRNVVQLITECALGNIIEIAMFAEVTHAAHQRAIEILQSVLNQSDEMTLVQSAVVVKATKKHLAFSAAYAFGLLERLVRLDMQLVALSLPQIREQVVAVEQMRGVGFDRGLRNGLQKIENAIKM